ncbi:hypothetical protein QTI66_38630 [Variovorax sp. J22R133]|uniref:hypothetical protein n=1 Tax=Variovorax brevis TaxID=3053503 RepID=UPI0025757EEA|nr:hypothetical protein [Variovorax sp. J22R133]MDM0118003.1 hypothetical protein [Variovorax sp. J22R133]
METRNNKTLRRARSPLRAAWLAAALIAGCGGGAELVLLVPFFTFGFEFEGAVGGANHKIFLFLEPGAPTTATGNFDASSGLTLDDTERHDVTGSYSGCTMTLDLAPKPPATTVPAPLAASYNGRFTGPNTLELTPKSGALPVLTLTRFQGNVDPRSKTC